MSFAGRGEYHNAFELAVGNELTALGFYSTSLTYHSALPTNVAEILRNRYSPTAWYLRHRADRIAVHTTQPLEFEWEIKTRHQQKYENLAMEAIQVCYNKAKVPLGVRCLYIYSDPFLKFECGFWASDMPPIDVVLIPECRWSAEQIAWFGAQFDTYLPGVRRRIIHSTSSGSNTPLAVINHSALAELPDWREVVALAVRESSVATNTSGNPPLALSGGT